MAEPEEAFWMMSSSKQEEDRDEEDDDSEVNISKFYYFRCGFNLYRAF